MDAASIIGLWPSPKDFAADVGEAVGTVYVWRHRERLPERAVARVYAAATARGFPVRLDKDGSIVAENVPTSSPPNNPTSVGDAA